LSPALGTNGSLRLHYAVTDGLLVYLNGQPLHAHNASFNGSQATNCTALPVCVTRSLPLTNLHPGTNWVAAAVVQCGSQASATYFGLGLEAVYLRTSPLPTEPPPEQLILSIKPQNGGLALSWPNGFSGYFLQYMTNLDPRLAWVTVSNQGNPYTSSLSDGTRFYRLRKP